MNTQLMIFALTATISLGLGTSASSHEVFQDTMKEIYVLKSFSCKACHPNNDDRKQMTMFAAEIQKELKPLALSEKWATVEPQGKEAIAEFEKSIVGDFKKAMRSVGQKQFTVDQFMEANLFNGARLDEDEIEKLKAAGEAYPQFDSETKE